MADSLPAVILPRLIVGLGNPGKKYADTRHNVGFMVLDSLAQQLQASWLPEKSWHCDVAKAGQVWLQKPLTFMNDSGRAVAAVVRFLKLEPSQVLVVYDDVDLPVGSLRMRLAGSAAGHNGVKSLIASLGTMEFPRIKMGVAGEQGRPGGDRLADYVLDKFSEQEKATLAPVMDRATEAVRYALKAGIDAAMNLFNRTEAKPA
jgi:peptidyl-tRNA hydrolase, PTH1 family